jgi:hypothetical protein
MTQAVELKPTLSPTALGNYETCARRGQYYHAKVIPPVSTVGLALGGAWHKSMETFQQARMYYGDNLLRVQPQQMQVDNLYQIAVGHFAEESQREGFVWSDGESVGDVHAKLWTMINAWADDPTYQWMGDSDQYRPISVEEEIVVELGSENHVLRGFLDLIIDTPAGIVGVDYKTAGRAWGGPKAAGDPRKLIQAPLYAEGWERQTGEIMSHFAYDVMTYAGKFQRVWVDVSPEKRGPFLERWNEVSDMIALYREANLPMPTNPGSNLCSAKWCSFWSICPMGEVLDRSNDSDD